MKQKHHSSMAESTIFLAGITFLGGFLDTYTYVTRGGVFANNHTGNVAKLGIELARGSFSGAWSCLVPIISCVLGAATSEWVKHREIKERDWRIRALLAESTVLIAVSFIPATIPDEWVNAILSFTTGFQLCLFRTSRWGVHNTTICTGNLRSVGQFLFDACHARTYESWIRLIGYTSLVVSFILGAAIGVPICLLTGTQAVLAGGVLGLVLTGILAEDSKEFFAICYPAMLAKGR